ncbi:hypothetical protein [Prosthecobacter sp.]|uniref:hypothetical protein n=1 Tax=Prosthecobacter sp. TaxID=1965333 RepID=UPI003782FAF7
MPAKPQDAAAAAAKNDDKLPPTPAWVMTILILVLLGLAAVTTKLALYPSMPAEWKKIFNTPQMPMADVNKQLAESHAVMESVKAALDDTVETWTLKHKTGAWSAKVTLVKSDKGLVYGHAEVSCDVTNLPSFKRTWVFPEKDGK